MKIQVIGPFLDYSGYAQASRSFFMAMHKSGLDLKANIVSFQKGKKYLGKGSDLIRKKSVTRKNEKIDVSISILTPEHYANLIIPGAYNIGFFYWEVIGLPELWVWMCNQMDEVWVCSETFKNVAKTWGVRVPIYVVPTPMDMNIQVSKNARSSKKFTFLSNFQWTQRKNPQLLLGSYWRAFENVKDVRLVLKVYRANFSMSEQLAIQSDIERYKELQPQKHYPEIKLILNELSEQEVADLYEDCDCYVLPHKGEGWGVPQMEAMAHGKPIISTSFGGIHEWLDQSSAWLIPFKYENVYGMDHIPWYKKEFLWAKPDQIVFELMMKEAYKDKKLTKEKGMLAQMIMREKFSLEAVGLVIKERLEAI